MKKYDKPIMEVIAVIVKNVIMASPGNITVDPSDDIIESPDWT